MDKTVITGDGIVHMSYAKQRVDSEMVPAGRFVLMLDCMLTLAININIQRKGKVEAVEAEEFLINCIEERILTLALWADGGVEVLELVRLYILRSMIWQNWRRKLSVFVKGCVSAR